jgi:hypothetical protein
MTRVVDRTSDIPGYTSDGEQDRSKMILESCKTSQRLPPIWLIQAIDESLGPGGQIFVDALDILADDTSNYSAIRLIRSLLNAIRSSKRESNCPPVSLAQGPPQPQPA